MKCPYCEKTFASPMTSRVGVNGAVAILLGCPYCHKMLGAVIG